MAATLALCDQLDRRLKNMRNQKAESVIAELVKMVEVADTDVDIVTTRLEAIERKVGTDLGELRLLNESAAGDSHLQSRAQYVPGTVSVTRPWRF